MNDRPPPPDKYAHLTAEERAEARRMELYAAHKARGTLGVYYYLYPEGAPAEYQHPPRHRHERGERER